jgi:Zn-finger protein
MNLRPRHRLPRGGNACDFCGCPEVRALYSCLNFDFEGTPIFRTQMGRWAACFMCSAFIEEQRWGQITRRVMREVGKRAGLTPADMDGLRESLKELHALFAKHVVQGEEFKVTLPRLRRYMLANVSK